MATYFLEQFLSWPDVNGGWSEGFYTSGTSHQAVKDKFVATGGLMQKRLAILGDWTFLDYIRISDVAIKGDAFHWVIDSAGDQAADATHDPTDPWTAMNVRAFSSDYSRNATFWLHGLWEEIFLSNRGYDAANPDNAKFDSWFAQIVTDGWQWKSQHVADVAPIYVTPAFKDFRKKTSKKIGRPFGLLSGRRAKKTSPPLLRAAMGSTFSAPATPPVPVSTPTAMSRSPSTGHSAHRGRPSSHSPTPSEA